MTKNIQELAKLSGDGTSIGVLIATFTGHLPALAAGATLIWTVIRIWETRTVRRWRGYDK